MANAIVKTERGDTLASIAARYYALHNSGGSGRASELGKVTQAIRRATPTRLAHLADRDPLPPDTTLFVPTLRELHRAVLTDNIHLLGALRAHGLDHARKLFRYSVDQVVALLQPLPAEYEREDIERAWMLTALADVDGMDHYTARHLYDEVGIHSLQELARQSYATLDKVLRALVAPPHSRPSELAAQRHGERWIVSAKILVRKRLGELTKIKGRFFQVPFGPALAQRRAEHYEAVVGDESLTSEEAGLASRLGRLYRFQAALLRGNVGVRSGNWAEAIAGYQEARRHWHRLAEATGAASAVNDDDGLNLKTCTEVARRLLLTLPGGDDPPLDAPALPLRRGGTPGRYRLHGFSYEELAPNRQGEIRARLASVPVHQLPRKVRGPLQQAVLNKTWRELQGADPNLVKGLVPGAETILARDLGTQDRETLRRNLGGTKVGTLYGGASKLDLFDAAVSRVALSELLPLVPDLWTAPQPGVNPQPGVIPAQTGGARGVLSDAAQAAYPSAFLDRPDVNPFTKFVVMPGEAGSGVDRFLPLTASFAGDYEREILKPRLMSASSEDLLFEEDAWTSVSAFATMAPYAYASQVPLGLRQAYGKLHQPGLAARFGGARLNVYDSEGALVRDISGSDPASLVFHPDVFLACSTSYTGTASALLPYDLLNYAEASIEAANYAYRHDDRATARSRYADVKCAIETVFPSYAEEAGLAMTGVEVAIDAINKKTLIGLPAERKLQNLTTLDVVVAQNGTSHRVMDGVFLSIRTLEMRDTTGSLLPRRAPPPYFEECVGWNPDTGEVTAPPPDVTDVDVDEESSGPPSSEPGWTAVFVDHDTSVDTLDPGAVGRAELYQWYLYCVAKIQAIDGGLNWYGYGDGFVPAWGFDHLYGTARDLCNRALEAEQRVFSLLQMYETAATDEFLAGQAVELARTQRAVARAKVEQQVASNTLALAQSLYTVQQADAQAKKSGVLADAVLVTTAVVAAAAAVVGTVASGGAALPAAAAGVGAAAGPAAAFAGNVTGHDEDVDILNQAMAVTNAVIAQNLTALAVAIAERDVAETQVAQAKEYVDFLLSKTLNSDAYYYLLGLAKEILEVYLHHANRMAWLAERALENETRQAYDLIAIDYTTQDELADLTRAQQITADLEALRSEYVAGQTARLQEVKWTIALSQLDPIAWRDLRDTGTATFVLRQRVIDRHFPGLHQHRLKDVHLTIVGLVPPEGARGVLVNPGVSWVRVPNEQGFVADQVKTDWVTTSLAGSQTFAPYDHYIMKQVLTQVVALTLSQFDARADRAVLSAPSGMLRPVEHLGLDSAWTLTLHRQSNNFDFRNIVDVELTFWFLAAYDGDLEQAQVNALTADGQKGLLTGLARTAFAVFQPQVWAPFVSEPVDGEALDLRYLTVDVANLPPWETERKVTNILLGCARAAAAQSDEITLRLCCAHDPVGVRLKTKNGAVYSLIDVDASAEVPPPAPDPVLTRWVRENLSSSGVPDKDPQVRWVIKASPQQAGEAWLKRDVDGRTVSTSSGPLQGWADGLIRYNDGGAWTDVTMQVKIAHRGGSVRLRLRDDGRSFYALQVTPSEVALLKSTDGAETPLGTPRPLAYPAEEYLLVEFSVVGDRLSAAVDGITLFAGVAGDSAPGELQKGTVALEVVATDGTKAVRVDDVKVWRLTGLGAAAEALLAEPFTTALPKDWTLVEGAKPWTIAPQGHRVLDLVDLLNVVLSVDYRYQMNAS